MMKTKNIIAILPWFLLLTSCTTPTGGKIPATAVQCTDPRPQVCTMDYTPVCATLEETAEMATYANACGACADINVIYHQPGTCEP
jgi:hypothetical protein